MTLLIGSQSTGQGHATSYAQLIAERLDLPPERVRVVQGDTDRIKSGAGTGGSSSIPVGGVSVDRAATALAGQIREIAADALEASAGDLEIADGAVRVAGTDRVISFADLAAHPGATPEKLRAAKEFSVEPPTYPNGTHIAEVEIDPETGATTIVNYVVVDDFGATLNPLLLAGQVHGGAVQGIGQALMEDTVYDLRRASCSARASWTTRCRARNTCQIFYSKPVTCRARPTPLASKVPAKQAPSARAPQ